VLATIGRSLGRSHDGLHAAAEFLDVIHLVPGPIGLVLQGNRMPCCGVSAFSEPSLSESSAQAVDQDVSCKGSRTNHVEERERSRCEENACGLELYTYAMPMMRRDRGCDSIACRSLSPCAFDASADGRRIAAEWPLDSGDKKLAFIAGIPRSAIAQEADSFSEVSVLEACMRPSAHPSSRACGWRLLTRSVRSYRSAKHLPILACRSLETASWFAWSEISLLRDLILYHHHELQCDHAFLVCGRSGHAMA
jgi:hypothetical protein